MIEQPGAVTELVYHAYASKILASMSRPDLAQHTTWLHENEFMSVCLDSQGSRDRLRRHVLDQVVPGTRPVLCMDGNPFDIDRVMARINVSFDPPEVFVLHWDATRPPSRNTAYWPIFFLDQRLSRLPPTQTRQSRISMLSGRMRSHRLRAFQSVRPYIQPTDVIVVNRIGAGFPPLDPDVADLENELPFATQLEYIDHDQDSIGTHDHNIIAHPAYRACVNVTAETLGPTAGIFVTEKTWKAIRAECLPYHFGCLGIPQYLEDLGFLPWMSQGRTWQDQLQDLVLLFQRRDLPEVWHESRNITQHNLALFQSRELHDILTQPALRQIDTWLADR